MTVHRRRWAVRRNSRRGDHDTNCTHDRWRPHCWRLCSGHPAQAQQRPQIETKKVEGTDNVYIFRNGNHQSIFVVTPAGVIATDPVAYGRPTRRPAICRRDQEGHRQADQVPDLQPSPLRSHRRRQGVQGCRRQDHRAQECDGASEAAQRSAHAAAGRVDRQQEGHQARRHDDGTALSRPQSLGLQPGDPAAEGKDHLRRRHHPGRLIPRPRHDRLLPASRPKPSSRRSSRSTGSG